MNNLIGEGILFTYDVSARYLTSKIFKDKNLELSEYPIFGGIVKEQFIDGNKTNCLLVDVYDYIQEEPVRVKFAAIIEFSDIVGFIDYEDR